MSAVPRVSVLIATYNWSSVLQYSVGSALRQTFADFELLVIGDGCTDDSESVVAAIGDPRVRWINLPSNSGHQSTPNNEGLRQARGEIIAYLGHDDLWLPHHLETCVRTLDQTPADVAYALMAWVMPNGSDIFPTVPYPRYGTFVPPSAVVHRRSVTEAIGGWRNHRHISQYPDVDLWRRAQAAGYRFAFVPRLNGIKLSAACRPGVYKTRPCHEQAEWTRRIADPSLEARLLAQFVAGDYFASGMPYRALVPHFIRQTMRRVRALLSRPLAAWFAPRHPTIDEIRRFKGLEEPD
jgi:glycosyltransferase involved in cell wall biosynthesis